MTKTAILIDGGFFRKRADYVWRDATPAQRAKQLQDFCDVQLSYEGECELYRIFYYDCPPSNKTVHHPFLDADVDLSDSDLYRWTTEFYEKLKRVRKLALRFGRINDTNLEYIIKPGTVKKLYDGSLSFNDLLENNFKLQIVQKGVDMRIGLDIASMAHKKQVDQMILISGDSDFVPIAKYARREGIDFIIDPMKSRVKPELYEHLDGLRNLSTSFNWRIEEPTEAGESDD